MNFHGLIGVQGRPENTIAFGGYIGHFGTTPILELPFFQEGGEKIPLVNLYAKPPKGEMMERSVRLGAGGGLFRPFW